MKYFILLLLMTACCPKTPTDPKFTPEGIRFWSDYSQRMVGKCLRRWDDEEFVVEIDTVNKKPYMVSLCHVYNACDYKNSKKCVNLKSCSDFSHGAMLYDYIQNGHYIEHKCDASQ